MTKEEYNTQKEQIAKEYGLPEYDMGDPINESARKHKELLSLYRLSNLKEKRDKETKELKTLAQTAKDNKKEYIEHSVAPTFLTNKDLESFNSREKDIIIAYFEDFSLTSKELSNRFGLPHQTISALFRTMQFKILYTKVFDQLLPLESLVALRQAMKNGDSKVSLRIAEHYGILKNEQKDVNVLSKPIDDPKAHEMLNQLADKIMAAVDAEIVSDIVPETVDEVVDDQSILKE